MDIQKSSIPLFYEGKSIFITGGTGFLGKIIIEKLLRSCPGIDNIYMLCRSNKRKDSAQRFSELTQSPIFDILREKSPKMLNKIVLINGDILEKNLGISSMDLDVLRKKVSIVIHSAATVRFTEPMKVAVDTNVRAVHRILALSRQMKKLEAIVHISTAFTNWFDIDVKEEVKKAEIDPNDMMKITELLPNSNIDLLTPSYLGKHVNTYTFTKSLGENLVLNEGADLPVAVIKPSLVGACMTEPKTGWIDSLAALSLYFVLIPKGLLRCAVLEDKYLPCEVIPADLVSNLVIAAAWKLSMDKNIEKSSPQVYTISTGMTNRIYWREVIDFILMLGRKYPLDTATWYPKLRLYKTEKWWKIDSFITHYCPCVIIDSVTRIVGKNTRWSETKSSILESFQSALFSSRPKFQSKNYQNILNMMSDSDRKEFNFDPKTINWKQYIQDYYFGIKKFVLKEQDMRSAKAVKNMTWLKFANSFAITFMKVLGLVIVGYILSRVYDRFSLLSIY